MARRQHTPARTPRRGCSFPPRTWISHRRHPGEVVRISNVVPARGAEQVRWWCASRCTTRESASVRGTSTTTASSRPTSKPKLAGDKAARVLASVSPSCSRLSSSAAGDWESSRRPARAACSGSSCRTASLVVGRARWIRPRTGSASCHLLQTFCDRRVASGHRRIGASRHSRAPHSNRPCRSMRDNRSPRPSRRGSPQRRNRRHGCLHLPHFRYHFLCPHRRRHQRLRPS